MNPYDVYTDTGNFQNNSIILVYFGMVFSLHATIENVIQIISKLKDVFMSYE